MRGSTGLPEHEVVPSAGPAARDQSADVDGNERGALMIFCCTKTCRSHGHPEIRVACEEVFQEDAALLLQGFEQEVAHGVVYKDGETIQIGWMICRFALLTDGTLELREPDFTSFPIQFVDTVSRTFAHVVGQREAHASVGLAWDTTPAQNSICDSALICDRVFSAEAFMMVREVPKGNDSGWFLGHHPGLLQGGWIHRLP